MNTNNKLLNIFSLLIFGVLSVITTEAGKEEVLPSSFKTATVSYGAGYENIISYTGSTDASCPISALTSANSYYYSNTCISDSEGSYIRAIDTGN